jgi:hypothetical protein
MSDLTLHNQASHIIKFFPQDNLKVRSHDFLKNSHEIFLIKTIMKGLWNNSWDLNRSLKNLEAFQGLGLFLILSKGLRETRR